MSDLLNTGLEVAAKSVDLIDTIVEKIEKYRKIKQDSTAYLRLLYLEVITNLEVFQTIEYKQFEKISVNDNRTKTILSLIQTEILESVFYKSSDTATTELFDKLKKRGKVNNRNNELIHAGEHGDDVKVNRSFIYENVLQAISFVVTKIELLNKYSKLNDTELTIVRPIKIKTRLVNIHQRLLMIKNVMDNMDEIKEMAR
jgi:hypothetical protein